MTGQDWPIGLTKFSIAQHAAPCLTIGVNLAVLVRGQNLKTLIYHLHQHSTVISAVITISVSLNLLFLIYCCYEHNKHTCKHLVWSKLALTKIILWVKPANFTVWIFWLLFWLPGSLSFFSLLSMLLCSRYMRLPGKWPLDEWGVIHLGFGEWFSPCFSTFTVNFGPFLLWSQ